MKEIEIEAKRNCVRATKGVSPSSGRLRRSARCLLLAGCLMLLGMLVDTPGQAMTLISEVYYDAPGSDNGYGFVELYGTPGSLLDGLTLEGVNGANGVSGPIVTLSGVIPLDGIFVVADMDSSGNTFVLEVDLIANFDFQNGPDSIRLMDGLIQLDAVGYGVFSPSEFFAGEGAPAPDAGAGESLARVFADLDTNDNAYDFVVLSQPTPGYATVSVVPEPGSGVLSAIGLVILAKIRRRSATQMI